MGRNRIYSFVDNSGYPPGASLALDFAINSNNRELKIKSIMIEIGLVKAVGGKVIPWQQNTDIRCFLSVGQGAGGQQITSSFTFTVGDPTFKGTGLFFMNPGFYQFDSFFITNSLPFAIQIDNLSADIVQVYYMLSVEVIENIIWQVPRAEPLNVTE